jgi:hypothetical protein
VPVWPELVGKRLLFKLVSRDPKSVEKIGPISQLVPKRKTLELPSLVCFGFISTLRNKVIKFLVFSTIAIEPHVMDRDIDLETQQVALQPAGAFYFPLSYHSLLGKFS